MVCLGVPTLRPLYLRHCGMTANYSSKANNTHATDPELPLFTMCEQKPGSQNPTHPPQEKPPQVFAPQPPPNEKPKPHNPNPSPEPTTFLRDSSSSRTAVDSTPSPEPCLPRPESAHTHTRHRSDSVDDILGLYDSERSRSRGRAVTPHSYGNDHHPPATIWVRSEFRVDVERQAGAWPLAS